MYKGHGNLPRKPVAYTYSELSPHFLLLWAKAAHYLGYRGFYIGFRDLGFRVWTWAATDLRPWGLENSEVKAELQRSG